MSDRLHVQPARSVRGTLEVPGDKSLSHRYVMLGGLSEGITRLRHLAPGADVAASMACLRGLGVRIEADGHDEFVIHGRGARGLQAPAHELDAANSGTTLRLLSGIVAACPFRTRITGDESLRRRPMRRVIDPLTAMGARIGSDAGRAPLDIDGGRLSAIDWQSPVASAQVKSAILLAGLRASGTTSVTEPLPTRDHTERMFPSFGLQLVVDGTTCRVEGGQQPHAPALPILVPGDPSSAAVWAAAAAALPGSWIEMGGVCLNPRRLGFARALERMGAVVEMRQTSVVCGEPVGTLRIAHGAYRDATIEASEVPELIDELPVLAARAALGGTLDVSGAGELRHKESDRITALVAGMRALGADADERPDGFVVHGGRIPAGGTAPACGDHRLVMAFALVGLGASGPSVITGADVVGVSYPGFERDLARLTA